MNVCNIVLSTEPRGGKGGVATVIPMYLEALGMLGRTEFIPTHNSKKPWGKFVPWLISFYRTFYLILSNPRQQLYFHLHPGSGICILRMLVLAFYLRCILRQKVIIFLHTPYLEVYLNNRKWEVVIKLLWRFSDQVVVLTECAIRILRDSGILSKTMVVPNPFKIKPQKIQIPRIANNETTIVLIMGRLVEGKGFIETLQAFRLLPDAYRLVIAGDGPLADQLRKEIDRLGVGDRVEMRGWVWGEAKEELLTIANIFCLPSKVDSFGMSFIEAQTYDLPIVAFTHPPVVEVLRSTASVLVNSLDPSVIAEAIMRANSLNSTIICGSGASWVADRYGVDRISTRLDQVIKRLHTPCS